MSAGAPLSPASLAAVMEATWAPARRIDCGAFTLRDGQGGGKRVSAATLDRRLAEGDLPAAEAAMAQMGGAPLFLIRQGDEGLEALLAARGYGIVDPVVAYAGPVARLARPPAPLAALCHWPPLAVTAEIWAAGGIGPARLAVMDRVAGRKTAILARHQDRCVGACFVAMADGMTGEETGGVAMLHALEVLPASRRNGAARNMLHQAACWAQDQGAHTLSLVVTSANAPARALYASLHMDVVGQYHYRQRQAEKA